MTASSARLRQLFLIGAAFVVALISCGREVTAPGGAPERVARGLTFTAHFPEALQQISGGAASIVPFTKVRIILHHSNGFVALDTLVDFPAGTDQLTLALTVTLLHSAPAGGEPMDLDLAYLNAAGETVFRGGPVRILAVPTGTGQPAPVQVPLTYSGPGANATAVKISPRTLAVASGDNFTFTAVAVDANGTTIPNTPIVWTIPDPTLATLAAPIAGAGTAKVGRGAVQVVAQLLTGASDVVTLTVGPKASTIAAVSGSGQSGAGGIVLAQPVVVKVTATDGLPMAGVAVTFAAASGGTLGAASVLTDASGLAQTTWTLGVVAGAQTMTATAASLTGSPVTFTATSTSGAATKLVVTSQPAVGYPGVALSLVAITAQDAQGNTAKSFTGPVTIALGANPGAGAISGTTTVNALAGVARFTDLKISTLGTGYTLVATSPSVGSVTTSAFNVVVPPAALIGLVSGGGQFGNPNSTLPNPIVVQVVDASGRDLKIGGVTINFTATTGGGSLTPSSAVTDTLGQASTSWRLGPALGVQTMTADSPGLTPITVRAGTAVIGATVWQGNVDSLWTNAANWYPATVPGGGDSVIVGASAYRPIITAPTSVRSLVTSGCNGSVRLTSVLTISGSLSDSTWYCDLASARMPARRGEVGTQSGDSGTVVLTGNGDLGAYVRGNLLITGGTHNLTIPSNISGSIVISGNAKVVANGSRMYVYGTLATVGNGKLQMTNTNDLIYSYGSVSFAGGSETGLLTAGTLYVFYGDFMQAGSPTAFAPSGTHVTYLGAFNTTQNVTFANPTTSFFQDLDVANSGTIVLQTDMTVRGTVMNAGGVNDMFTSAGGKLMTVSGLGFTSGASISFNNVRLKYVDGVSNAITMDGVSFFGFAPGATIFEFSRTSGGPYNFNNLVFSGALNTSGRYVINTGTVPLTLTTPSPNSTSAFSICGCTTWYSAVSASITWP